MNCVCLCWKTAGGTDVATVIKQNKVSNADHSSSHSLPVSSY